MNTDCIPYHTTLIVNIAQLLFSFPPLLRGNQERALELHDVAIRNCRSFQELQQVLMTKEVVVAQRKACQEYGINPVSLFEERLSQLQASGGQF